MYGREQREGENLGRICIETISCFSQHMRSVSLSTTKKSLPESESSGVTSIITEISSDSFYKDGRKIKVGDCALFKPPQDSPPFIGIIRWLRSSKENYLHLGVNWLYRPAEVKLDKGILLDAAPNEIFYSFHKDEIPAASLLHPCKVAFLPQGVELPSEISSFVCRRVYDIDSKCLWWLTDQDYINERQEEVDKLLQRTRVDMDASFVPGNRSPKPTINSMSASQFKPGSDNVQSSSTYVSFQTKGKKRERGEQPSDPVKRGRTLKQEDGDSGLGKLETSLRSEIAKMTERGGLVDSELVEKLVQLMQPDKVDKKMDLICRSLLAGVIAGTDKFDCLNRFLQLKGLPVFDEWLQDVHKGKIGDGDKSAEEFLLILLRALDKLPVNLHALQTCNIGRSVNHLRSHKNSEIQKKARSLVDTWKKRVEAEMNMIDAKSGSAQITSWPSKPRINEAHGSKNPTGSSDVALKSSVTQLAGSKVMSVKVSQVETAVKSASSSPVAIKSASSPAPIKEGQPRTGCASDVPLLVKEDKSSSSSQSHNHSPSFSGKEDARSSTAGSMSVNKISSGASRHRKSINGFPGTSPSSNQKETSSTRNSYIHRNSAQEKFSHSVSVGEKVLDGPAAEGSTHKLIVKIPNRGRSPAESASGGSCEDPSIMSSRASSPVLSDKHEGSEHNAKEKGDAFRANILSDVNAESWQSNDFKDLQAGSDEGDGSPGDLPDEEQCRTVGDTKRVPEVPKAASSSSGNDLKSEKLHDPSYTSMNALIESCVKYSEANMSMSLADDMGMNLLASVATGEMCKSDLLTPAESPQGYTSPVDETCLGEDAKSKSSSGEGMAKEHMQPNYVHDENVKQCKHPAVSWSKNSIQSYGDGKTATFPEETLEASANCMTETNEKKGRDGDPNNQPGDREDVDMTSSDMLSRIEEAESKFEVPVSTSSMPVENKDVNDISSTNVLEVQKPSVISEGLVLQTTLSAGDLVAENCNEVKVREADENHGNNCANQSEGGRVDPKIDQVLPHEDQNASDSCSDVIDKKCLKANVENNETEAHSVGSSDWHAATIPSENVVQNLELGETNKCDAKTDGEKEQESATVVANSFTTEGATGMDSKMNFDLNEGLIGDDGKYGEPVSVGAAASLSSVQVLNSLTSAALSSIPATITVTAAAKGSFVPPVDLLRNKVELGWKGSAATSAFRPAEPRKALQLPLGSPNGSPNDDSTRKLFRPPLDIDLNVPDERLLDDLGCRDSTAEIGLVPDDLNNHDRFRSEVTGSVSGRSSGGLDLDLNRVDDSNDILQCSTSSTHILESPFVPLKASGSFDIRRDFDLNNGPVFEDSAVEQSSFTQYGRGSTHSISSQPAIAGIRSNNLEAGSFSSWFSPGTSYSSITIPSALPDRGDQPFPVIPPSAPQRILDPTGGNPFPPDVFRSIFPSSPAGVPFTPSSFAYHMFPFGTTLPLPSATFSVGSTSLLDSASGSRTFSAPGNSQFSGPVGAVLSQYPMVSLSDSSNNGVDSNRKWNRQGLDLNAGPGVLEMEGREETLAQRQLFIGSSQSLAEEQARMFSLSGGVLKRKEPDGWDRDNLRYKQSSWQ